MQAAYFATRRTKGGEIVYEDSKTGESEKDREAYDLIMRDKERLLSFDEPTCFIFSHSALREGWDSPNVFQICTLNQSTSEMRKRQEIGRGVRLAVNQTGDRVRDERINVLTVVIAQLNNAEIRPPRLVVAKARLEADSASDKFTSVHIAERRTAFADYSYSLPNLVEIMANLMERTTPPMRLARHALLEIARRTKDHQGALDNPHEFATVAVQIIKHKLADQLVDGIRSRQTAPR